MKNVRINQNLTPSEKGHWGSVVNGETSTIGPLQGRATDVPPIAFNVFCEDTEFVLPVGKIRQVQRRSRRGRIWIVARKIKGVEDVIAVPLGDRRVVGFLREKKPSSREGIVGLLGAPKRSLPS